MTRPMSGSAGEGIHSRRSDPPSRAPLRWRRTWKHIVRDPVACVLVSPALVATLFWLFVLCAAIASGAWPHGHEAPPGTYEFEHPSIDPSSFGPLYLIVGFCLFASPVLILLGAGVSVFSVFLRGFRRDRTAYVAFAIGSALLVATVAFDLGGGFDWFID